MAYSGLCGACVDFTPWLVTPSLRYLLAQAVFSSGSKAPRGPIIDQAPSLSLGGRMVMAETGHGALACDVLAVYKKTGASSAQRGALRQGA
jgi:hypothetical protein